MKREPKWLTTAVVLAIHESLLAEHGGAGGLRDLGLLEAALASPRHHFAYDRTEVFVLAAAYAHALIRDHPFHDGNKRVALTSAGVFLELNGHRLAASEADAVRATMALADRKLDLEGYAAWLEASVLKRRAARAGGRRRGSRG